MPLSDGDPASDDDTWFRVITDEEYLRADGRLKNRAFTGKAIAPPKGEREWQHELSGRLLSFALNVETEAKEFCTSVQKDFAGVMYSAVAALRFAIGKVTTDVRYTPLESDKAHADFVSFKSTEEDLPAIRDKLQELVRALKPTQLGSLGGQEGAASPEKPA